MSGQEDEGGATARWGDFGPFAIIPVWILEHDDLSDRAVRLYGVLARYAGCEGSTFQGKRALAQTLRCAKSTLEAALAELLALGVVEAEERTAASGARLENGYVVHAGIPGGTAPPTGPPRPTDRVPPPDPPGGFLVRPLSETTDLETTGEQAISGKVDRKSVTSVEAELAGRVLAEWNRQAEQQLTARDWLAKIVMRIRERPDLGVEEHAHVIAAALADPWWQGAPTPSVVYGSGAQFERSLLTVTSPSSPRKQPMRFGRGLTAQAIVDMTRGRP